MMFTDWLMAGFAGTIGIALGLLTFIIIGAAIGSAIHHLTTRKKP